MTRLIRELKNDILNPSICVSSVLKKAWLIANNQDDRESANWIQWELNGYPNKNSIPEYRKIEGELKYRNKITGWKKLLYNDDDAIQLIQKLSQKIFGEPIIKIEQLIHYPSIHIPFELSKNVSAMITKTTDVKLFVPRANLHTITESVRNKLLCWLMDSDGLSSNTIHDSPRDDGGRNWQCCLRKHSRQNREPEIIYPLEELQEQEQEQKEEERRKMNEARKRKIVEIIQDIQDKLETVENLDDQINNIDEKLDEIKKGVLIDQIKTENMSNQLNEIKMTILNKLAANFSDDLYSYLKDQFTKL